MKMIPGVEHLLPLYVVLGRPPGANAWQGYIEESFSMGWSTDRVRLWWSGKAYSLFGEHRICGREDAESHVRDLQIRRPGWVIEAFDLSSEDCPITIDLKSWRAEKRKFEQRNPLFLAADPEELLEAATEGQPFTGIST